MKNTVRTLWANEFVKGGMLFTIASFAGNVINYFFNLLAARGLGPAGFGEISALFSYITLFSVPMLVMSLVIIQKIGSRDTRPVQFTQAIEMWFISKVLKWWPAIIIGLAVSPLISRFTNLSILSSYFLIPITILTFFGAFYGSLLQGLKLFAWLSFIGLVTVLIKLAGAVVVTAGLGTIATILIFLLISALFSLLASAYTARNKFRTASTGIPNVLQKRVVDAVFQKHVIVVFLSVLSISLLNNIDIIFVKKTLSAVDAGIYSSWSLFAKIILYLTGPVTTVSYIFFSRKSTGKNHEKVLFISLCILAAIGITGYVIYTYFSSLLISLFFGSKFIPVARYISSASIFGTLYTTVLFLNNYFLAKKSNLSLLLLVMLPVYLISLNMTSRTLDAIISLNIGFTAAVTLVYLVAYGRTVFYNGTNGQK